MTLDDVPDERQEPADVPHCETPPAPSLSWTQATDTDGEEWIILWEEGNSKARLSVDPATAVDLGEVWDGGA